MFKGFTKEIQITKTVFDKDNLKEGDKVIYKHKNKYCLFEKEKSWDSILECEIYKVEDEDLYLKHMGDIISLSISDLGNNYFYSLEKL